MTLTINTQVDDQRQLTMTVEVGEDRVKKEMQKTMRKLAQEVNIPGFRKGKVPTQVITRRFGEETIRLETIDDMTPAIFEEAVTQASVEIYAQPALMVVKISPLVLEFKIPLAPEVKLGDYRAIRQEVASVEVSDKAVDDELEALREKNRTLEDVERPIEVGDLVNVAGKAELLPKVEEASEEEASEDESAEEDEELEDSVLFDSENLNFIMDPVKTFPGTPFVENLLGLSVGDEKDFNLLFPADFEAEEMAGREATFHLKIQKVQKRDLPALDDELAKKENADSLEALRHSVRENLVKTAEHEAKDKLIEDMVDKLLEIAEVAYPPAAVELELDDLVESFKGQVQYSQWVWEDYLKMQNKTEEDIRVDFRETAVSRLRRQLVLRQLIQEEQLAVKEEEMSQAVEERVARFDNPELQDGMRKYFSEGYGANSIRADLLMDKVAQRITLILNGNAPALDTTTEENA